MHQGTRRRIRWLVIGVLAVYGPFLAIYMSCISGIGFWEIPGAELFILVPLISVAVAAVAVVCIFVPKWREGALSTFVVFAGLAILFFPVGLLATKSRSLGFYLASQRAEPIVAALRRYQEENGSPPAALADLAPKYLSRFPSRIPPLELVSGSGAESYCKGNRWILRASASTGILNWDEFLYFEAENYDQCHLGTSFERPGSWVYYHE